MTVDEARSLGKPLLLSDIPAHREQSPERAVFFDPYDHMDLAMKMECFWHELVPGPDFDLEAQARSALSVRVAKYAESFVAVAEEAVANAKFAPRQK